MLIVFHGLVKHLSGTQGLNMLTIIFMMMTRLLFLQAGDRDPDDGDYGLVEQVHLTTPWPEVQSVQTGGKGAPDY